MQVLKYHKDKRYIYISSFLCDVRDSIERAHIFYFYYLIKNFNIIAIVGDYNGGVQFINAVNESELFKSNNIKIKTIDGDFDKMDTYKDELKDS